MDKIRRNEEGGNGGARAENVKASVARGGEGIAEGCHRERGHVNIELDEEGRVKERGSVKRGRMFMRCMARKEQRKDRNIC